MWRCAFRLTLTLLKKVLTWKEEARNHVCCCLIASWNTVTWLLPPCLMKLICTKLRKRLTHENLTALMRICKYQGDIDYEDIKNTWLRADDTKSKTRRVNSRLHWLVLDSWDVYNLLILYEKGEPFFLLLPTVLFFYSIVE